MIRGSTLWIDNRRDSVSAIASNQAASRGFFSYPQAIEGFCHVARCGSPRQFGRTEKFQALTNARFVQCLMVCPQGREPFTPWRVGRSENSPLHGQYRLLVFVAVALTLRRIRISFKVSPTDRETLLPSSKTAPLRHDGHHAQAVPDLGRWNADFRTQRPGLALTFSWMVPAPGQALGFYLRAA